MSAAGASTSAAPCGAASISLGMDDSKKIFEERQADRAATHATPDAASRFGCRHPNDSSIEFGASSIVDTGAPPAPVGGLATIVLGTDDSKEIFTQRQAEHSACLETPDAAPRFPQVPNASSVPLGSSDQSLEEASAVSRGPVGGPATIRLGIDDSKAIFTQREEEHAVCMDTPDGAQRFMQVPNASSVILGSDEPVEVDIAVRGPVGGSTSICLGDTDATNDEVVATKGPVGGETSIVLGEYDTQKVFADRQAEHGAIFETPDALPRFQQVPNACSVPSDDTVAVRGPVGGACTVVLGGDDTKEILSQRQAQREAVVDTPDAAPRFQQVRTACSAPVLDTVEVRGPVGGETTVVLGGDDSKEIFSQRQADRDAIVETPDAAPRFAQVRTACSAPAVETVDVRGPVGGETNVVLGGDDSKEIFSQRQAERDATFETPDAAPRFQQVRTACSVPVVQTVDVRGAVGGEATVVLGGDDSKEIFSQREAERTAVVDTPNAAARFSQVRTACSAPDDSTVGVRGPVGGEDTLVFGLHDSKEDFDQRQAARQAAIDTPDAAPRFAQTRTASSIINTSTGASAGALDDALVMRGPVGGADTLVLGGDDPKVVFDQRQAERQAVIETPDAVPRFVQAPGGSASIILGGDTPWDDENEVPLAEGVRHTHQTKQKVGKHDAQQKVGTITYMPSSRVHHAPGGQSSICLGSDDHVDKRDKNVSSNKFANGANQNCGNTITDRSTTRLHYAPGGASTICLGSSDQTIEKVSSNRFADGSNQNCGNTITDRSTTRLHHAPGGASSICLGSPDAPSEKVSANKFANGANQNAGNVITDRSTTRLHQAPGGASSLCLGSSEDLVQKASETPLSNVEDKDSAKTASVAADTAGVLAEKKALTSSNRFANGSNQNCGNVLTDKPSTRLHQAPGGTSTVCLGSYAGDENMDTSNQVQDQAKPMRKRTEQEGGCGGATTIILG